MRSGPGKQTTYTTSWGPYNHGRSIAGHLVSGLRWCELLSVIGESSRHRALEVVDRVCCFAGYGRAPDALLVCCLTCCLETVLLCPRPPSVSRDRVRWRETMATTATAATPMMCPPSNLKRSLVYRRHHVHSSLRLPAISREERPRDPGLRAEG